MTQKSVPEASELILIINKRQRSDDKFIWQIVQIVNHTVPRVDDLKLSVIGAYCHAVLVVVNHISPD